MKRTFLSLMVLFILVPVATVFGAGTTEDDGQMEPVVFYQFVSYSASEEEMAMIEEYYEEQTGLAMTLRFVKELEDWEAQLDTAIAAEDDIDVIHNSGISDMVNLKTQGVIKDITDAVNEFGPNMQALFSADVWKSVTIDDRIWSYPMQFGGNGGAVIQIRKDWRETLGLDPITTVEEFGNYLRLVRDGDLDGNGVDDAIPFLPFYGTDGAEQTLLISYIGACGSHKAWYQATYEDSNGNIVPTVLHPGFADYLATMNEWYENGLIYRDLLTASWSQEVDLVSTNLVGAVASWYNDFYGGWRTLSETVPEADYEIILLEDPDGARRFPASPGQPSTQVVSWSDMEDEATQILDWFVASEENYLSQWHGIQGTHWDFVDRSASAQLITRPDPNKHFASLISYFPWNGKFPAEGDWQQGKNRGAEDYLASQTMLLPPDWFVPYDFSGSAIESSSEDASTLINEGIAAIIIGERPVGDWPEITAEYRALYGDDFIEIATEQFNEFK